MRDGAGCLSCQSVFHRSCPTEQVCPNCGKDLLSTETVHATRVAPPAPAGIGGWLLLPAIGFFVGALGTVIGLIRAIPGFPDVKAAGYGGIFALDLTLDAGLFVFLIYAAKRFFDKKTDAPAVIIRLFVARIGANALLLVVAVVTGAPVFMILAMKQLAREALGAAVWIPYFRLSTRVKATFIN
jgi:hypothetical protein